MNDFFQMTTPGKFLGSAIEIYTELLRDSGCQSWENLTKIWKNNWRSDCKLRDAVEELWATEEEWNTFLQQQEVESQDECVRKHL